MMNAKGQSLLEYSVLIIIVLAVFIAMQNYVKRGIQGRWKSSTDQLGDQYDPRLANSTTMYRINSISNSAVRLVDVAGGYWTTRTDQSNTVETKSGATVVGTTAP